MPDYQQTIDTATSLAAIGKYGEAVEVLDSLAQSEGESIPPLLLRARIAAQRGLFEDAESFCLRIDRLAPQGPDLSATAEIRAALKNSKGARYLGKWLAISALLAVVLLIGLAYFVGRRSGMSEAREQLVNSLGRQQIELSGDVQRQDRGVRDLMNSITQMRQSLERIDEQQRQSRGVLDRRVRQMDARLKSLEDQIHGLAATPK